ncbi:MAG TPA: DUF2892 domain-containing protein [Coleofasciculaceae cyanobacterium]
MARVPIPGIEQNMGILDRIVRGTIGGMLVMNFIHGLSDREELEEVDTLSRISGIVGGAFVIYGLTGWDPLLKIFNTNTQPGNLQNLFNRTRRMMRRSKGNGKHAVTSVRDLVGLEV